MTHTRHPSILIVDDDPLMIRAHQRVISLLDAVKQSRIHTAENIDDAVECFRQDDDITLVISDFEMPGGYGDKLYFRIKEDLEARGGAFIVVTGVPQTAQNAFGDEPVVVLGKPYDKDDLHTEITNALQR